MNSPTSGARKKNEGNVVKLQGKIPVDCRKVATSIQIETEWQKYITYRAMLRVAVQFPEPELNGLTYDQKEHDVSEITSEFFNSPKSKDFRRKYGASTKAEFFRKAIFRGAQIFDLVQNSKLPDDISAQELFETVMAEVGTSAKMRPGLIWLGKTLSIEIPAILRS